MGKLQAEKLPDATPPLNSNLSEKHIILRGPGGPLPNELRNRDRVLSAKAPCISEKFYLASRYPIFLLIVLPQFLRSPLFDFNTAAHLEAQRTKKMTHERAANLSFTRLARNPAHHGPIRRLSHRAQRHFEFHTQAAALQKGGEVRRELLIGTAAEDEVGDGLLRKLGNRRTRVFAEW